MEGPRIIAIFNPDRLLFRAVTLAGICFLTFGSYFIYDIPGALTTPLTNRLDLSDLEYSALYSVYSWPNAILALVGGFLIDRVFGIRLGAIVFCTLVFVGQFIFAIGIQSRSYWVAVIGRFVFGLGGESLSVAQSTYTARWFKGKELALAFGITLSFSRVGSAVNFNTMPWMTDTYGLPAAIWISVVICSLSMVIALGLAFMDKQGENSLKKLGKKTDAPSNDAISVRDVVYFPLSMWLLVFICIAFYVSIFVFIQFGDNFFQKKWGLSETVADRYIGIPSLFSAGASPFLGFGVDKIARNLFWVVGASSLMCGAHLLLHFSNITPIAGMVIMGAAYSTCAAALWPGVALIIAGNRLGTAYGLMTALQNLGLAVAPLIVGKILDATHKNYTYSQFIFAGCAATAAVLAVILIFVDLASGLRLNASPARLRTLREAEERAAQTNDEEKPLLVNN
jgi:MFS family permease